MSGFIWLRVRTKGQALVTQKWGSIKGMELLDHVGERRAPMHRVD